MLTEIIKAWSAGQIIKDPAKWKSGAEVLNYSGAIVAMIIALLKWKYPDFIVPEEAKDIALQLIGGFLAFINVVINRISTRKKISFSGKLDQHGG